MKASKLSNYFEIWNQIFSFGDSFYNFYARDDIVTLYVELTKIVGAKKKKITR